MLSALGTTQTACRLTGSYRPIPCERLDAMTLSLVEHAVEHFARAFLVTAIAYLDGVADKQHHSAMRPQGLDNWSQLA